MPNQKKHTSEDTMLLQQNKSLIYTTFLQQEEERYHHTYDEELLQYEYVKNGDLRSATEWKKVLRSGGVGKLSDNPLRNLKYLFVSSTTMTTRTCIENGMDAQTAYNLSDLYIQEMDKCNTMETVEGLFTLMFTDFTNKMALINAQTAGASGHTSIMGSAHEISFCKPVIKVMDYIYYHLHQRISLEELSRIASLTPNYLASLFKQETGYTIQNYIRHKKVEAAQGMLLHSEYTLTEIGEFLAFSSSSHFIRIFKEETGLTPRQYQRKYYRKRKH